MYIITGKTGSGKTYNTVKAVYPRWLAGVDIYANMELYFDPTIEIKIYNAIKKAICKITRKNYKPKRHGQIFYFYDIDEIKHIKNAIILLDEGQEYLGAYNWKTNDQEFIKKLRMQRKQQLDIYTTSQNISALDINYRKLVQGLYYCRSRFHTPLSYHYTIEKKDTYELYNKDADDLKIKTNAVKKKIILKIFNKRLYNTFEEISSKALKIVWLIAGNKQKVYLIRRSASLKPSLTAISTLKSELQLKTSKK